MATKIDRPRAEFLHDAAEIISKMRLGPNDEDPQQAHVENDKNSVAISKLRNFCIRNEHPLPSYDLVGQTGPVHAPRFTMKCTVSNITKYASASTKKVARQLAARKVLLNQKELTPMSRETASEAEGRMKLTREKLETHDDMETLNEENILETIDFNRHNFFKDFPKDKKTKAYEIMNNAAITSSKDKMDLTLKALQIPYKVQEPTTRGSICLIELCCELDVVIGGTVESVYGKTIEYLQDMLS